MTVTALAWGYGLIEGPRPAPDGSLYFSDVRRGGVRRLAPDGTVEVVVPKRRGVGGIVLHADGGLVISGRNVCHVRDGETRVLLERDGDGGFNDLFTDAGGRVYVGSIRDDPFDVALAERKTGECYRIAERGQVDVLYAGVGLSNGIGFSPDGRRLYHVDTVAKAIVVHDLDASGELIASSRATFATVDRGFPDGLAVDADGGVWVALYQGHGVHRYGPGGTFDRRIDVPAEEVTSLCFAGPGLDELIVVTADNDDAALEGTIFRVSADEVGATGVAAPLARV